MSNVQNLVERVAEAIRKNGIEPYFIDGHHKDWKIGDHPPKRTMDVAQTFRYNHSDLENITATITVSEWTVSRYGSCTGKQLLKIKVPANASDKVIQNRINKALAVYNA